MKVYSKALLALSAAVVCSPASATVVAHWTFDSEVDFNAGIVRDVSGNGNDLSLVTLPGTPAGARSQFVDLGNGQGAVRLNGSRDGVVGDYFTTAVDAPLNSMDFQSGYTVEVSFKVPESYNPSVNRWMGMLAKTGKPSGDPAAVTTISNLGEIQWQSQAAIGENEGAVWSPVFFSEGNVSTAWTQAAYVNYGSGSSWNVDMYVDQLLMFRNIADKDHQGIRNYGDAPWFVGTGLWNNEISSPFNGWINDIRILETPLQNGEAFGANLRVAPVPVPAAFPLMAVALAGMSAVRRRA